MTELAAGVNSSETLWTVDEVPDPEFGYYTVDSEIVKVVADFPGSDPGYAVGQSFPSKIRVTRGVDGTTAASHDAGAALTAANAFSGGPGATFIIGPFSVTAIALADAALNGVGDDTSGLILLAALSEGTLVAKAWAILTEEWDGNEPFLTIQLTSSDGMAEAVILAQYGKADSLPSLTEPAPPTVPNTGARTAGVAKAGDLLKAGLSWTGAPEEAPTTGAVDIYALLAVPD